MFVQPLVSMCYDKVALESVRGHAHLHCALPTESWYNALIVKRLNTTCVIYSHRESLPHPMWNFAILHSELVVD